MRVAEARASLDRYRLELVELREVIATLPDEVEREVAKIGLPAL